MQWKINKYVDLARELKTKKHEGQYYASFIWCIRNSPQESGEEIGGMWNQWENRTFPDYDIAEIGKNTVKSPEDLRRHALTQTPVKDHRLTLLGNTCKEYKNKKIINNDNNNNNNNLERRGQV